MASTRPVDESMSLLHQLMHRPVDPSYAAAASRRVARGLPRSTSTRTVLLLATCALLGFLLAVSAVSVRAATATVGQARAQLLTAIEARQSHGDQLAAAAAALEREVTTARSAALEGGPAQGVLAQLAALQLATGAVAATGPGVRLLLDDAAASTGSNADPRGSGGFPAGRVSAADLQIVTNGLWAAGAEALAVNGHRLTARSAIRFVGEALLVDYRPLARPYVIEAIADPSALRDRFTASSAGRYLTALADTDHIRTELTTSESMTLPADPGAPLRHAQPQPQPQPSVPPPGPAR